jgi:hypothetical protein
MGSGECVKREARRVARKNVEPPYDFVLLKSQGGFVFKVMCPSTNRARFRR